MYVVPLKCPSCFTEGESFFIKRGYFYTKHNYQPDVPRYTCLNCGCRFSSHSDRVNKGQKKPELNAEIMKWVCSGVTLARIAKNLKVNKRTVARKIKWLSERAMVAHKRALDTSFYKTTYVQFDELEAYEHTPLKPLSVAIAVRAKTGFIIDMRVATMNAHGHIAETSREKYGFREDTRKEACTQVVESIKKCAKPKITIACDSKRNYPTIINSVIPHAKVESVLSVRRKRGDKKHDPLFAVNNLCAKLRADLAVLSRKTMSTLKKAETLQDLLNIYIAYNNRYDITSLSIRQELVPPTKPKK